MKQRFFAVPPLRARFFLRMEPFDDQNVQYSV